MNRPTDVADVVLPVEIVTLTKLRTRGGGAVQVGCEALDEMTLARITRGLPGGKPAAVEGGTDSPEDTITAAVDFGEVLIEHATFLSRGDEGQVRPAFWFTADPENGALPGRYLKAEDRILLITTILRLGGYLGGAAGDEAFPGERGRRTGGVGAVAPGEGDGDATARPDEPARPDAAAGAGV